MSKQWTYEDIADMVTFITLCAEHEKKCAVTTEEQARALMRQGYRRTSYKHSLLARIDRDDWREHMTKVHGCGGEKWVADMHPGHAADQYRRCYTQDKITVSRDVAKRVLTSGGDPIGFIP